MSTTSWQGIIAISTTLPVICIGVVGLRFHARIKQKATFKFDDWIQIPNIVFLVAMAIPCFIGVAHKAIGYPDPPGPPTVTAPSTVLSGKLLYAQQLLQCAGLTLVKISALAFYRRIFCTIRPSLLNMVIWILIGVIAAWGVAFIAFRSAACGSHPEAAWEGGPPYFEYCIVMLPMFEKAFAISDFVLDSVVLIVPLPSIWNLQMTTGRKLALTAIFMLALVGYGACIARLASFILVVDKTFYEAEPDLQSSYTQAMWYMILETGFSILAVNLPSLGSVITKVTLGSISRSIRSILSLGSSKSGLGSTSKGTRSGSSNPRSYPRKNSTTASQNIELVATEDAVDVSITAEKDNARDDLHMHQNDLESGIYVQMTLNVASTERL